MKAFLHLVLAIGVVCGLVVLGLTGIRGTAVTAQSRISPSTLVALGDDHSCAVLTSGVLKCWGKNDSGQLGIGGMIERGSDTGQMGASLMATDLNQTVKAISGGYAHTCAIRNDNTTVCWGNNESGQLGIGSTTNIGDTTGEMGSALAAVNLGTGLYATAISAGHYSTCAILNTGAVKCWGSNDSGILGVISAAGSDPSTMGDALPTVDLGTGRTAKAIATGYEHVCAILDNDTVKCWGANASGQLGQGDTTTRAAPSLGDALSAVDLGSGRTAKAIAAGGYFNCVILDTGAVTCWGMNATGQLGIGSTATIGDGSGEMGSSLQTVNLGTGRTALAIAASRRGDRDFVCVILDTHALKCWGANDVGQLGTGDMTNRGDVAGQMATLGTVNLGTGVTVTALSMGNAHTCVILNTTNIKCFGHPNNGKLGAGNEIGYGTTASLLGDKIPIVDLDGVVATRTKTRTRTRTKTPAKTATRTRTRTKTPTKHRSAPVLTLTPTPTP